MRDPVKMLERSRRYRRKKKVERYGAALADVNMSGCHGNHARGADNGRWRGGRFRTSHGYIAVRVPPDHPHAWGAHPRLKYAYEHIVVAMKFLGRPLRQDEVVHHLNENKEDNRKENLEVLTRREHAAHHAEERGRDEFGRFPPADLRVREFPGEGAR